MHQFALAAGTVPDAQPIDCFDVAAAAGFDRVGLRLEPPPPVDAAVVREICARRDDSQCSVLDLEVIRLGPEWDPGEGRAYTDLAHEIGADYLLCISLDRDEGRTTDRIAALAQYAAAANVRVILEFMVFTQLRTLTDAVRVARAADADVLVDALHLHRSGGTPSDVRAASAAVGLPYVQLCDAPLSGPDDPATCRDEALHHRLAPGEGELPVRELVDAITPMPIVSVEVQSDVLARLDPFDRARRFAEAARSVIAGQEDAWKLDRSAR